MLKLDPSSVLGAGLHPSFVLGARQKGVSFESTTFLFGPWPRFQADGWNSAALGMAPGLVFNLEREQLVVLQRTWPKLRAGGRISASLYIKKVIVLSLQAFCLELGQGSDLMARLQQQLKWHWARSSAYSMTNSPFFSELGPSSMLGAGFQHHFG